MMKELIDRYREGSRRGGVAVDKWGLLKRYAALLLLCSSCLLVVVQLFNGLNVMLVLLGSFTGIAIAFSYILTIAEYERATIGSIFLAVVGAGLGASMDVAAGLWIVVMNGFAGIFFSIGLVSLGMRLVERESYFREDD
jgi:hypothetical protein